MTAVPAFVVALGFPRSGTTLLSRIFDAHPEVSCPPETNLLAACGRFLEETGWDGPPLGVLSGLALAGVEEEVVLDALRGMVLSLHERLAGGRPVRVEKSGFDIFHLDAIERLFAGRARFLCTVRHPLDVVASVKDLVEATGHWMPPLHAFAARHDSPYAAIAEAWIERADALRGFLARHPEASLLYRYEDLVGEPDAVIGIIARFLGVAPPAPEAVAAAFADPARIGLGDWKIGGRRAIDAQSVGRWRQVLPRATAARLIPRLAPAMEAFGYPVPKAPRLPDRPEALRAFVVAQRMRLSTRREDP